MKSVFTTGYRHPRGSGGPDQPLSLDSRFRGNDEKKVTIPRPAMKRIIRSGDIAGRFDPGRGRRLHRQLPDLPNGRNRDETREEALAQAEDLLGEMILGRMAHSEGVPAVSSLVILLTIWLDRVVGFQHVSAGRLVGEQGVDRARGVAAELDAEEFADGKAENAVVAGQQPFGCGLVAREGQLPGIVERNAEDDLGEAVAVNAVIIKNYPIAFLASRRMPTDSSESITIRDIVSAPIIVATTTNARRLATSGRVLSN